MLHEVSDLYLEIKPLPNVDTFYFSSTCMMCS